MPKFKNTRTGRVVDLPSKPEGFESIKGADADETRQIKESVLEQHQRRLNKHEASERWERVGDNTKVRYSDRVEAATEE